MANKKADPKNNPVKKVVHTKSEIPEGFRPFPELKKTIQLDSQDKPGLDDQMIFDFYKGLSEMYSKIKVYKHKGRLYVHPEALKSYFDTTYKPNLKSRNSMGSVSSASHRRGHVESNPYCPKNHTIGYSFEVFPDDCVETKCISYHECKQKHIELMNAHKRGCMNIKCDDTPKIKSKKRFKRKTPEKTKQEIDSLK